MPRLITDEQRKELERNVLNLNDVFTVNQMKQFADKALYDSGFLPELSVPTSESSKFLIHVTRVSQECDVSGRYVMGVEGEMAFQEKIYRTPLPGQPVYFNEHFLGNVKESSVDFPYFSKSERIFQEHRLNIELELPFTVDLFHRLLKLDQYLEATVCERGVIFGSGSDFEDLAKITLEEEKSKELTRVCVDRNWFPYPTSARSSKRQLK
jgi:hypothetical protein